MRKLMFRTYHAIGGVAYWSERTFTAAGMLVLAAAILSGVFGIDTTQSTAYRMFAFLAVLLCIALVGRRWRRGRFAVERMLPRTATSGMTFEYRLRVTNLSAVEAQSVSLRDELVDPRPDYAQFSAAMKWPSYRGWLRTIERNRVARVPLATLDKLPPGAVTEVRVCAQALRRGRMHFTGLRVGCDETLGLVRGLCTLALEQNLIVLPRRYALPPLSLPGGRRYQQGGVTLASSVGDSEEFIGLRNYRPGDPLQRVHWKSFARLGRPVVREYQDEYFERYGLILDTFGAASEAEVFEEAVAVAASFACTIDTQECMLDLMFVGAEPYTYTAGRGQLQAGNLLEVLAGVELCADQPFEILAASLAGRAAGLSGCVCILLGWDHERADLIDQLRARGSVLRVLAISKKPIHDAPSWLVQLVPGRIQEGLAAL